MPKPSPRVMGPIACENCAKAKSKCLPGPTDHLCQRCHRLRKSCISQTPAPRRERKGKRKRPSRTDEFERRLEELSARLDDHHGSNAAAPPASNEGDVLEQNLSNETARVGNKSSDKRRSSDPRHLVAGAAHGKAQPSAPFATFGILEQGGSYRRILPRASAVEMSEPIEGPQEYVQLVERYCKYMQHLFPFVIVPRDLASPDVGQQQPFLWRAVNIVASDRDELRSTSLVEPFLKDVVEAIVLRSRQDIDLIQGLLVLIAWYHWALDKYQISNLLALARSQCDMFELSHQPQVQLLGLSQESYKLYSNQARTYCGWYYLSTIFFTITQNPSAVCSSSSMAVRSVWKLLASDARKQPLDDLVVSLTQIQQLAQSVSVTKTSRRLYGHGDVPLVVITSGFRQQTDRLRQSLPAELMAGEYGKFLRAHLLVVEIMIYETAISDCIFQPEVHWRNEMVDMVASQCDGITDRVELLSACLELANNFLINHTIGSDDNSKTSYLIFAASLYCYQLCLQLTSLDHVSGWNIDVIKSNLHFKLPPQRSESMEGKTTGEPNQTFTAEPAAQNSGDPKGGVMPSSEQHRAKNRTLQNEVELACERLSLMLSTSDQDGKGDVRSVGARESGPQNNQDTGEMRRGNASQGIAVDVRSWHVEGSSDRTTGKTTRANDPASMIGLESDSPWPMNPAASLVLPVGTEETLLPTFGGTFPQITLWPRILP
ncbi:hypothetical protein B0J13DRAFT_67372 [Dactylonectria estremocensis]|uniref:Zn(2)-C6 fungal-type domain-containing protein n=1 Tax=Dactylonectria estremocensis TaxID=1079267 RepID=A0A9P9EMC2_9HYPO|nr:hypothetical protein B0J13DRAFT_67372 [Dactylonectria estremocensis]